MTPTNTRSRRWLNEAMMQRFGRVQHYAPDAFERFASEHFEIKLFAEIAE